jgi:thiol-disulfide isomerase/thioredoxin
MARRAGLIALALAAVALGGGAWWSWRPQLHPALRPAAATAAADPAVQRFFALNLDDADGRHRPLSEWRGKLLVVNFWATWCTPCVEEMPLLQRVADQYSARNVAVIGIGVDDADKVREFRGKLSIRFPLLVAGFDGMDLARQLGDPEPVLPYTALVSPSGRVVEQQSGRLKDSELRGWLVEHAGD